MSLKIDREFIKIPMRATLPILLLLFPTLSAAAFTWDGSTDSNVSVDSNWAGNKTPSGNPDLQFGSSSELSVYFDFGNGATTTVDDLTFTSAAGSYTISSDGSGVLSIGNVDNQSTSLQIFDIPLEFQNKETVLAGGPIQFNQAVTTKTGNNQLTFTGGSSIIAGADNVFNGGIELVLQDTILDLSGTDQSFSGISISGDSVIDFGGSDAVINLDFLEVLNGTLTIQNWTGDPGDFIVSDSVDSTSLGNITFDGLGDASWDPTDGVTPGIVPEPSTYGAILMALLSGSWMVRRRRTLEVSE
jgi:hypothetical protein